MFGFLLALHVVVTILLLFIILIQKSEGGSSLFSSGSGTSMFNARGTSSMLTKATWGLAAIFLLNCILMAHISANKVKASSTIITGTPHVSRPLSNKAIDDLNKNKEDNIKKEVNDKTKNNKTETKSKSESSSKKDNTSNKVEQHNNNDKSKKE